MRWNLVELKCWYRKYGNLLLALENKNKNKNQNRTKMCVCFSFEK